MQNALEQLQRARAGGALPQALPGQAPHGQAQLDGEQDMLTVGSTSF